MTTGILLIHGFSGRPSDLYPLQQHLLDHFGPDSVSLCSLPGHRTDPKTFDRDELVSAVAADIRRARERYKRLAILGHSTGGSLAVLAMAKAKITAEMLILAAVPFGFDKGSRERWQQHRQGAEPLNLSVIAGLVSAIVAASRQTLPLTEDGSLLLVHGEEDALVLPAESRNWQRALPPARTRLILVPEAGHQVFTTGMATVGINAIRRAVSDLGQPTDIKPNILERLKNAEPEAHRFLTLNPLAGSHLARCPGSSRLAGQVPDLSLLPDHEPVFANIEITTRCNLACPHCARQSHPRPARDMSPQMFERLLDLLPQAYRITLVGLGEPLLHPLLVQLVALTKAKGRRVAIATNAMALTGELSTQLLAAGLDSIAFSLDAVDPGLAARIRPGSDMPMILEHICAFTAQARTLSRPVSLAVFTAVSTATVEHLEHLVVTVKQLGVHVLMASDLNFRRNGARTLWQNREKTNIGHVRRAVTRAFTAGLPVLSVRGLEEFGLAERYNDYLLLPPEQLFQRSARHRWCLSPWQTLPIDVEGNVSFCDCRPEARAGNLFRQPLDEIWNGEAMVQYRRQMLSESPPADCLACPRF
jgi:MoaA/NifB/PqqE/SkfB family radical SAM enzyme/pimeloyl-ACP methyl ester carboxylesterase